MSRKKKISDPLARVMRKVVEGKKLTKRDTISGVIDAVNPSKKGKRRKKK